MTTESSESPQLTPSTRRFSSRVPYYHRYRPRYPRALLDMLAAEIGLTAQWVIADIGSGTGISSELFLQYGCTVYGVEPNDEMRAVAEDVLRSYPRFRSVSGQAEETTLPDMCVDLVIAGQAFHWFQPDATRAEFSRILKVQGLVCLFWNVRELTSSPFTAAFEALVRDFSTDYGHVTEKRITRPEDGEQLTLKQFFDNGEFEKRAFPNAQVFDFEGLKGRALSASYVPLEDDPRFPAMLERLHAIFEQHQQDGQVRMDYTTELFWGRM